MSVCHWAFGKVFLACAQLCVMVRLPKYLEALLLKEGIAGPETLSWASVSQWHSILFLLNVMLWCLWLVSMGQNEVIFLHCMNSITSVCLLWLEEYPQSACFWIELAIWKPCQRLRCIAYCQMALLKIEAISLGVNKALHELAHTEIL